MYDADFEREVQEDYRRRKKWRKRLWYVRIGCLSIVFALVLIIATIILISWFKAKRSLGL